MVQEISGCNQCWFCHRTHERGGGGGSHGIFNTNNIVRRMGIMVKLLNILMK
jgi:hypothetical protein